MIAALLALLRTPEALELARGGLALIDQARGEERAGLLDQHTAPIGNRQFIKLAERRLKRGASGAFKIGRRWLMERSAMAEEMTLCQAVEAEKPIRTSNDDVAELRVQMALLETESCDR